MRRRFLLLLGLIVFLAPAFAQEGEDWNAFRERTGQYYHYLLQRDVDNFSFELTSKAYIDFIAQYGDSTHYYPLKFIWTSPEDRYYVLQTLPAAAEKDSLRREMLLRIQDLKNLWEDILFDFKKYIFQPPMYSIPDGALARMASDTVGISYKDPQGNFRLRENYAKSGLLREVVWEAGNQRTITHPVYKLDENKWYCVGWQSQKTVNGEVTEGLVYGLEPLWIGNHYLPNQVDVAVQAQRGDTGEIVSGLYRIFLRDLRFNELIEVRNPGPIHPRLQR
ncbi:MAG TPA: hypothetical protein PKV71_07880 [Calditrichia bacterium]|nr:hypothetical protein [Calditrichota bacterium]HQV31780.1 hypothetical protein [Calditrichia bacterium]